MRNEIYLLRLISVLSFSSVALALVSQYAFDMQPCAWCVFQRLLYVLIGVIAIGATLAHPTRARLKVGSASILAIAIAGVLSALYQEKVAANTFSCAQTFADQLMAKSGLDAAVPWLFGIYASCMDARVKLLGIEYAWWSLAMFCVLGMITLFVLKKLFR